MTPTLPSVWPKVVVANAERFPVRHPAEADVFARHIGVPGHNQEALGRASVLVVGAGGLGGWIALALARTGVGVLTIVDGDTFELSNAPRQLMFAGDLGRPKATAVATNVAPHMVGGGTVIGIAAPFDDAVERYAMGADLVVVGVDNNACRWSAGRYARTRAVPAIFTMLSTDGMRIHSFLQGASAADGCLWCGLPNLDPDGAAPCASGVITSCLTAAAHVSFFAHRALMGWPDSIRPFNWRASDIAGVAPDEMGYVIRRADCPLCGNAGGDR